MTRRTADILLKKSTDGSYTSQVLELPATRVLTVLNPAGGRQAFEVNGTAVSIADGGTSAIGRVEFTEDLVAASAVERTKVDLDREKIAAEERGSRRTLWFSLGTAVVSAAATVVVALVAHIGAPSEPAPKVPTAYKDLADCRESLHALTTLANLEQETLPKLREAIGQRVEECSTRLDAAIAASQ